MKRLLKSSILYIYFLLILEHYTMPDIFKYTKQMVAKMIAIDGFWTTIKYIDYSKIIDPELSGKVKEMKDLEYYIKHNILSRFAEWFI